MCLFAHCIRFEFRKGKTTDSQRESVARRTRLVHKQIFTIFYATCIFIANNLTEKVL